MPKYIYTAIRKHIYFQDLDFWIAAEPGAYSRAMLYVSKECRLPITTRK
jgi:hypothetical protein